MLWRIEYFVEGKNLEKALAGAAGIAINMSTPQPVSGATLVTKGDKKQVKESADRTKDASYKTQFIDWVKSFTAGTRITSTEMREHFIYEIGASKASFNNLLMQTIIDGAIVKRISRGQYQRL